MFYEQFGRIGDAHEAEQKMLWSLVNARNCLAHFSGVVTARHLHGKRELIVSWRGIDLVHLNDEVERILPRDAPYLVAQEDVGSTIRADEIKRERSFREGEVIRLSEVDIAEIIAFYRYLALDVLLQLGRFVVTEAGARPNGQ